VADLHITVDGRDSDVESESLQDWLRAEPEFRGHLRQGEAPGSDGAMGASPELIVEIISSGVATALVTSLRVWLTQRRADVTLKLSGPDGRKVDLNVKRIPDAERLVNTALGWAEGDPPQSPPAG
jgi:Effector Associated Constant Component 1